MNDQSLGSRSRSRSTSTSESTSPGVLRRTFTCSSSLSAMMFTLLLLSLSLLLLLLLLLLPPPPPLLLLLLCATNDDITFGSQRGRLPLPGSLIRSAPTFTASFMALLPTCGTFSSAGADSRDVHYGGCLSESF